MQFALLSRLIGTLHISLMCAAGEDNFATTGTLDESSEAVRKMVKFCRLG